MSYKRTSWAYHTEHEDTEMTIERITKGKLKSWATSLVKPRVPFTTDEGVILTIATGVFWSRFRFRLFFLMQKKITRCDSTKLFHQFSLTLFCIYNASLWWMLGRIGKFIIWAFWFLHQHYTVSEFESCFISTWTCKEKTRLKRSLPDVKSRSKAQLV